ncbi:MAG: alpha/beta fold hydrolase [Acidobacteriota bacterium]
MTSARLNLQNTPDGDSVVRRSVSFPSSGQRLAGTLFLPSERAGRVPGVVVTGAWTTVKEQMPGTYARELATRGFAALTFDFTGWGESGGAPRYVEDPSTKTDDVHAAVDFLASLEEVDERRLAGLGICASSGYIAATVADHPRLQRLAMVAPWLHDPAMAEQIYGGAEGVAGLIEQGRTNPEGVLVAASTTDPSAPMFGAPYYTEADRGLIPEYDNRFGVASWQPWLTYDAQQIADRLTAPTLIVCSEAAALPAGARAFTERLGIDVTELWLDDVSQFDFYDRRDVVERSVEAVAVHFAQP